MPTSKSIVIVGGGIIGLSAAWYALQKGHEVTVLERNQPDGDCCSYGNAGYITPSHIIPLSAPGMPLMGLKMMMKPDSPFRIQPRLNGDLIDWAWKFARSSTHAHVNRSAPVIRDLNLASRRLYIEYADEFGNDFNLEQRGLLMLCKTESALLGEKHLVELAGKVGLEARMLTPGETAALEPNVRLDIAGAVYFSQDCHLAPRRFMATLTRRLIDNGATIRYGATASGWKRDGGDIAAVQTSNGDVTGDEFVIAGGAWSPPIARSLGLRLPMQAGKGYSITIPDPPKMPRIPMIPVEARIAITPMGNELRVGGTMDVTGLEHAETIQQNRVDAIRHALPRYLPDFTADDFAGTPAWTGLRPCSPDGLPYVGRASKYANLCVATGHAMMGMSLGPITGKLIAETISGEKPEVDMGALAVGRFERFG